MRLYHGTSVKNLKKIFRTGLAPRGVRKGVWPNCNSAADRVYLTRAYPLFFAQNSSGYTNSDAVIIEIDTNKISLLNLLPDEDFLGQALTGNDLGNLNLLGKGLIERTEWYRDNAETVSRQYAELDAFSSLKHMGNCSYKGVIPVEAIKKVVKIDSETSSHLIFGLGMDPTISLANYKFLGNKYRWLTDLVMGNDPDPNDAPRRNPEDAIAFGYPEYSYAYEIPEELKAGIKIIHEKA